MEYDDLCYLCTAIGNLSGIPVRLYRDGEMVFSYSIVSLPADPVKLELEKILAVREHVACHVTASFDYYCAAVYGAYHMVVGPSRQIGYANQDLRRMAFQLDVPGEDVPDFMTAMRQIIRMPLESMIQMMCTVNFALNREKLVLNDVIGGKETAFHLEEKQAETRMEKEQEEGGGEAREIHNTLATEQTIMNIIRKGDEAALEAFVAHAPAVRPGVMASDQLRQARNAFIVAVTEASRSAIRGGMDVEEAMNASDAYIQQCEAINDVQRLTQLHYDMVLYYTRSVARIRSGHYATELVLHVANYVQKHLSESITTGQVAEALFLSRQHLSRRFTQEAGMPLAAFIRREKIEEAKRLLRYTDKPAAAIALYLGFSSQSHFARVFKEVTGMTPGEYREKKHM